MHTASLACYTCSSAHFTKQPLPHFSPSRRAWLPAVPPEIFLYIGNLCASHGINLFLSQESLSLTHDTPAFNAQSLPGFWKLSCRSVCHVASLPDPQSVILLELHVCHHLLIGPECAITNFLTMIISYILI